MLRLKTALLILLATAPAHAQSQQSVTSKPVFDLIERLGLSKDAPGIAAIWVWEEPGECAKQLGRRYKIQESVAKRICDVPKEPAEAARQTSGNGSGFAADGIRNVDGNKAVTFTSDNVHSVTGLPTGTQQAKPGTKLTNEAIIRMVKAGLGDEIILNLIQSSPGSYSVTPDDLIALKISGVADPVISAILSSAGVAQKAQVGSTIVSPVAAAAPLSTPLTLRDGTPVKLRLARNLSSSTAQVGETVDFEVLEDLKVEDLVVISRGSSALATVTEAQAKRRMARGGKLNVNIDYVRLANGEKAALRALKELKGGGHTGAMTAGIVVTSLPHCLGSA